jgi:hypothetical protein
MKKHLVTAMIVTLSLSACGTTRTINGFKSLADFGNGFEELTEKVIDQGTDRRIESTNQQLANAKRPSVKGDVVTLRDFDAATIKTIQHMDALGKHAALLSTYFGQLDALAAVDGESKIATATSSIVSNLADIGGGLKLPDGASGSLGALAGKLFVGRHTKVLKRELMEHGDAVQRHLRLQTLALEVVRDNIASDEATIAAGRIEVGLLRAYGSTEPLPDDWSAKRRELLLAKARQANAASKAVNLSMKLETAFAALAEGRLQPEEMAVLTFELEKVLAELGA